MKNISEKKALEEIINILNCNIESYSNCDNEDYYPKRERISDNCFDYLLKKLENFIYKNSSKSQDIFDYICENIYFYRISDINLRIDLTEADFYSEENCSDLCRFFEVFKISGNDKNIDADYIYKIDAVVEMRNYFKSIYEKIIISDVINKDTVEKKRRRI